MIAIFVIFVVFSQKVPPLNCYNSMWHGSYNRTLGYHPLQAPRYFVYELRTVPYTHIGIFTVLRTLPYTQTGIITFLVACVFFGYARLGRFGSFRGRIPCAYNIEPLDPRPKSHCTQPHGDM